MDTGDARWLNCSSPSCLNSGTQRTDFFHGLLGPDGSGTAPAADVSSRCASPPLRSGSLSDTPATGAVLGAYGPNASVRPANGPAAQPRPRTTPAPSRVQQIRRHRIHGNGPERASLMPPIQIGTAAITATNGNQKAATWRRSGTGWESRSRSGTGTRCDQPCRPIATRQRPELTPDMPDERCKQSQSLNLHPQFRTRKGARRRVGRRRAAGRWAAPVFGQCGVARQSGTRHAPFRLHHEPNSALQAGSASAQAPGERLDQPGTRARQFSPPAPRAAQGPQPQDR